MKRRRCCYNPTLQGLQKTITVDNIREILGTGSKTTIANYLRTWKVKQDSNPTQHLPRELAALVQGLWERLQAHADQQIAEYQREAHEKMTVVEQEYTVIQRKNVELQSYFHQLEESLERQRHESANLQKELQEHQTQSHKAQSRSESLETQLQQHQAEVERLHQLLRHVQANLEHYQAAVQKRKETESLALEKQQQQHEQQVAQLQQELHSSLLEKSQWQVRVQQADVLLLTAEQKYKSQSEEMKQLVEKNNTLQVNHEIGQQSYQQLLKRFELTEIDLKEQVQILSNTQITLTLLTQKNEQLRQFQQQAEDKIQALRDEKLFLAQEKAHLEGQFRQLQASLAE